MVTELLSSVTVQILLLALIAGVCMGAALVGTGANLLLHRTGTSRAWISWGAGVAGVAAAALVALVVYIGMTTTYVSRST